MFMRAHSIARSTMLAYRTKLPSQVRMLSTEGPTPEMMVDALTGLHAQVGHVCPRMHAPARKCPLRMPAGHVPMLPGCSNTYPVDFTEFTMLVIGIQAPAKTTSAVSHFRQSMYHRIQLAVQTDAVPFERVHSGYEDP